MFQTRGMIVAACIVCLGIGYFTGSNPISTTRSGDLSKLTQNSRQPRSSPGDRMAHGGSTADEMLAEVLKGRSIQDLSEIDLVELVVQLSKYDPNQDSLSRDKRRKNSNCA